MNNKENNKDKENKNPEELRCLNDIKYFNRKTTYDKLQKDVSKILKMDGYEHILEFCMFDFIKDDKKENDKNTKKIKKLKNDIIAPDLNSNDILQEGLSVLVAGEDADYISPLIKDLKWRDVVFISNQSLLQGAPNSQFLIDILFLEKHENISIWALIFDDFDEDNEEFEENKDIFSTPIVSDEEMAKMANKELIDKSSKKI